MAFESVSLISCSVPPKFNVDFGALPSVAGAVELLLDAVTPPNENPPARFGSVLGASLVSPNEKPGVLGSSALLLALPFASLLSLEAPPLPTKENAPPFEDEVPAPNENNPGVAAGLVSESLSSFFSRVVGAGFDSFLSLEPNENPEVVAFAGVLDSSFVLVFDSSASPGLDSKRIATFSTTFLLETLSLHSLPYYCQT